MRKLSFIIACLAVVGGGVTETAQAKPHQRCPGIHEGIRFYRTATHTWQQKLGYEITKASKMPIRSCKYAEWVAKLWQKRAKVHKEKYERVLAERARVARAAARANGPFQLPACTVELVNREGGMRPDAVNPYSGAYGAPQALPGSKMKSAGSDWATNLWTQLRWMIGYVNGRYGGMCNALAFQVRNGWY